MHNNLQNLLQEWEKNCKDLFQLSPQPMWLYDVSTLRFLDVNEAAVRHYGYSRSQFLSMTIREIRPAEDLPILNKVIEFVRKHQPEHHRNIHRHQKSNGEIIDVQVQSNFLEFKGLKAELILVTDITAILKSEKELKLSKQELLKSEKRFKTLVQGGADLIAIVDIKGVYRFVSESAALVIGFSPSQLLGKNVLEFVHPEDKERVLKMVIAIGESMHVTLQSFRFLNGANEWIWLTTKVTKMLDDPAIGGIVLNSRDITEIVVKREELRLSNERYKLVLKASDEAILDWDIENDYVDWGSGFQEIFGYDLSVYNNTIWSENIHPEDKEWVEKELAEAVNDPSKEVLYSEYRFLKANREVTTIQYRAIFLRNENGKAIRAVGSFRDITANKESLYQIQQQNEVLKEIAWAQSHRVRAPLARILALTTLLEDEDALSAGQKELLSYLSFSAVELDTAIKNIVSSAEARES